MLLKSICGVVRVLALNFIVNVVKFWVECRFQYKTMSFDVVFNHENVPHSICCILSNSFLTLLDWLKDFCYEGRAIKVEWLFQRIFFAILMGWRIFQFFQSGFWIGNCSPPTSLFYLLHYFTINTITKIIFFLHLRYEIYMQM